MIKSEVKRLQSSCFIPLLPTLFLPTLCPLSNLLCLLSPAQEDPETMTVKSIVTVYCLHLSLYATPVCDVSTVSVSTLQSSLSPIHTACYSLRPRNKEVMLKSKFNICSPYLCKYATLVCSISTFSLSSLFFLKPPIPPFPSACYT